MVLRIQIEQFLFILAQMLSSWLFATFASVYFWAPENSQCSLSWGWWPAQLLGQKGIHKSMWIHLEVVKGWRVPRNWEEMKVQWQGSSLVVQWQCECQKMSHAFCGEDVPSDAEAGLGSHSHRRPREDHRWRVCPITPSASRSMSLTVGSTVFLTCYLHVGCLCHSWHAIGSSFQWDRTRASVWRVHGG